MVGDRDVDLIAAHRNGLRSAGVLWGYGSQAELKQEQPRYLLSQPYELVALGSPSEQTTPLTPYSVKQC